MIKTCIVAAALTVLPLTAFAQTTGAIIRDPTGGSTRDPALPETTEFMPGMIVMPGAGAMPGMMDTRPVIRDAAGGTMHMGPVGYRAYVMEQQLPSYSYARPFGVGTVMPARGIMYHAIPAQYGARGYVYTVVNDHAILVEPRTHRVVEIIN